MQQGEKELDSSQEHMVADGVLVERILAGEQRAFELVIGRYQPRLTQLICHILGISTNDDRVTTILQETWLQLYRFLPTYRKTSPLYPWLVHVTRNLCLSALRHQRRHPLISFSELARNDEHEDADLLETVLVDPCLSPEEIVELRELHSTIQRAFDQLPSHYQKVLFLRYNKQIGLDEIGQQLKIPKKAVQNGLYRARLRMREVLCSDGVLSER